MAEQASILIVDDQAMTLASLRAVLELDGYQVYAASDGVEALDVLKVTHINLILADIAMPRMNGYELFETVRQNVQWVQIPFIFLTARSMDSDIRYGKELGVDDYLTKPYQLEDLRASVAGKLRRAKQRARLSPSPAYNETGQVNEFISGLLRIQPDQHRVFVGNSEVVLSNKEFSLLLHLARNGGQVVTLEELCKVTHDINTNIVEAGSLLYPLIRSLLSKLAAHPSLSKKIKSVRGVGYCLD